MAAMIDDSPKAQKIVPDKKDENSSFFQCKKLGHFEKSCLETPLGYCCRFSKTGDDKWHWRIDCLYSKRGALKVKTLAMLAEATHD
jgi:hypothetical protein